MMYVGGARVCSGKRDHSPGSKKRVGFAILALLKAGLL